jgi:hypothetical protein
MATTQVSDRHPAVSEVDDAAIDGVLRRAQCRDRAVDFGGVGTVT